MKHELSKERLAELASDFGKPATEIEAAAMARALLAALEQEPVAWLNDAYLARGVVDGEAGSEDNGPGYIPVYRQPHPAPSGTNQVDELVMWVKRLAHSLKKANPDSKLHLDAMDYLKRNALIGITDVLRVAHPAPSIPSIQVEPVIRIGPHVPKPGSTGATDLLPPPSAPTALPMVPSIPAAVPDYFAGLVAAARVRADKAMRKFPQPNYVLNKVAEESGEVIKAVIHYTEGREEWANVEGELIDNLAMLIRLVTEGDQVIGFTPPESCRAAMLKEAEPVSQPYKLPMQPIVVDEHGTLRFKENQLIRKLLDYSTLHGYGLNEMALDDFTPDDRMQLAQLIGYSLSGYGELSFVSDESYNRAAAAAPKAAQNSNVIGHYQGADGNEHPIVNLSASKGV